MTHLKKWLAIFICISMVLSMAGCGSSADETDNTDRPKKTVESDESTPETQPETTPESLPEETPAPPEMPELTEEELILLELAGLNGNQLPEMYVDENGTIDYIGGVLSEEKVTDEDSALAVFASLSTLFEVPDAEAHFQVTDVRDTANGKHYTLTQFLEGTDYPVSGGYFFLITEKNVPTAITGTFVETENVELTGIMSADDIIAMYEADNPDYLYNYNSAQIVDNKLTYLLGEYNVDSSNEVLVNALTGELISRNSLNDGLAETVQTKDAYQNDIEVTLDKTDLGYYAINDPNRNIEIRLSNHNRFADNTIKINENTHKVNNFLNTLFNSKVQGFYYDNTYPILSKSYTDLNPSAVTLLHTMEQIYDVYVEVLNHKAADGEGKFPVLIAIDAAAEFGATGMYGEKERIIYINENHGYLYADIPAITHEYQHCVTANVAGRICGEANEAYSDIFGCLIEGYLTGDTDWVIGQYTNPFTGETGEGVRGLASPKQFDDEYNTYITDYSEYYPRMDKYDASSLLSHTVYLIYNGVDGMPGFRDLNGQNDNKETYKQLLNLYYKSLKYNASISTYKENLEDYGGEYRKVALNVYKLAANEMRLSDEEKEIVEKAFEVVGLKQTEYIASDSISDLINAGWRPDASTETEDNTNTDQLHTPDFAGRDDAALWEFISKYPKSEYLLPGDEYVMLGWCYTLGVGVSPDKTIAAEYYKLASDAGSYRGMQELVRCYLYGEGVEKSWQTALEWFYQANETRSNTMLDLMEEHHVGDSLEIDMYMDGLHKVQNDWLTAVADDTGNTKALIRIYEMWDSSDLASFSSEAPAYAFNSIKKAAEMGDPEGMAILAYLYTGYTSCAERNFDEMLAWMMKAAEAGETSYLPYMCLERSEEWDSPAWDAYAELCRKLAAEDDYYACQALYTVDKINFNNFEDDYLDGLYDDIDYDIIENQENDLLETMYQDLRHGADLNNAACIWNMAQVYESHRYFKRKYNDKDPFVTADEWRLTAAPLNPYFYGQIGLMTEHEAAESYFKLAADAGVVYGMNRMGVYAQERGDVEAAEYWYQLESDVESMYRGNGIEWNSYSYFDTQAPQK